MRKETHRGTDLVCPWHIQVHIIFPIRATTVTGASSRRYTLEPLEVCAHKQPLDLAAQHATYSPAWLSSQSPPSQLYSGHDRFTETHPLSQNSSPHSSSTHAEWKRLPEQSIEMSPAADATPPDEDAAMCPPPPPLPLRTTSCGWPPISPSPGMPCMANMATAPMAHPATSGAQPPSPPPAGLSAVWTVAESRDLRSTPFLPMAWVEDQ